MSWVKLDDQFFFNRKAVAAGLEGRALFVASVCFCGLQLNDGRFARAALPMIAAMAGVDSALSERLVSLGLWHDHGTEMEVHDYLKYNPSRQQAVAAREKAANAAAARWNPHGHAPSNAVSNAKAMPIPSRSPTSPSSSNNTGSSAPGNDDDELWQLVAQRKLALQAVGTVQNPTPWLAKCARNARTELADRAAELLAVYDVPAVRLAEVLANGGQVPPDWNFHRR